ncbi:hypothetical protein EUTSA_v10002319mg [Eutrema salsugineum]|uniref:Ubiquitin-like protease family profile domain-containing protein n=1 Tax=Eutrema salsugineum TaxID=72664 RepID=V4M1V9_EUTSA|nr:hypothetical protein EUTSA_v10002319mg [Eutrema salsugineum]
MDDVMYLFREYTALRRWTEDHVVLVDCYFAALLEGAYKNLWKVGGSILSSHALASEGSAVKRRNNKTQCDCGVYALKYIECHARGLDLSLMQDDNINTARMKIACDLFEAANDPVFIDRMSRYELISWEKEEINLDSDL